MKRANGLIVLLTLLLTLAGCSNYFHDLIPPDGNRILSFSVEGMIERAAITANSVDALVDNESPVTSLVPRIEVSPKATLLPMTYEYLSAAFPNADILQESAAVYRARDLSEHVLDLIKRNPDFNVPALKTPIDFSGPVNFLVISGQGTIRQYTARIVKDTGEPRILGFTFSKYSNPELIRDAFTAVNQNAKTIHAAVLYPVEMGVSYALAPSFEILGDRLEVDGAEIKSGVDSIQFAQALGTQTKTLTVWRNGTAAEFTLTVEFGEDPDSVRSITDFRFNKAGNAGIAATAVGSIANSGALGTINVQVFYSGARPSVLVPSFLSPGTVSVAGVTQVSGVTSRDFSQAVEYRVVSRNNLYTRTYTVVVDFIDIAASAPTFTSFKFSSGLNHELVQDTESQISEGASLIMITARYGGTYPPEMLIPEFRATGLVTVFGSVQTSGFSAQNFSTQIKYTVSNPENSLLKRDYWVQVTFIRDTSSAAQINSFSFHPDENPGLADEVEGRIDQSAGTITVFAPVGSGITGRTMIPRFRAAGQVLVEGDIQISGTSGHLFNAPIVYEAVSANGANRKAYTVTVRELQSTIFVNPNAFGHGDGASWADAFRELGAACEAAALFPDDVPKEIWIAAGTYKPQDYFPLAANTSYIGGFAGSETAKSQRNVTANKTVVSGGFNGNTAVTVNGDLSFENLEFAGAGIRARLTGGHELRVTNCDFKNIQASGAVYLNGGELVISSANFADITCEWAIYGTGLSAVSVNNVDLHSINGIGLYLNNCSADMAISNVDLQNISNNGVYITGGSGRRELSRITGNRISGNYGVYVGGSGVTLTESRFDTAGRICLYDNNSASINISDTVIKNVSGGGGLFAIYTLGGNILIERVNVENISGRGIDMYTAGTGRIIGSSIKNCTVSDNGGGIHLGGFGSVVISGTTIENVEAGNGGGIYVDSSVTQFSLSNTTIRNARAAYWGGGLYYNPRESFVITDSRFENCRADDSYGAIFKSNFHEIAYEIINTTFLNCTARDGNKFLSMTGYFTFNGCTFEDNNELYDYDSPTHNNIHPMFGGSGGYFENCIFTNLTDTHEGEKYIFSGWYGYPGSPTGTWSIDHPNTLKNCQFNFNSSNPKAAGLLALPARTSSSVTLPYHLLMDGVTINNNGSPRPLIWLYGNSPSGLFQFKLNNVYNGTPLDTAAAINALTSTGVIRLTNGARVTVVP